MQKSRGVARARDDSVEQSHWQLQLLLSATPCAVEQPSFHLLIQPPTQMLQRQDEVSMAEEDDRLAATQGQR
jgi:hypothetical protein